MLWHMVAGLNAERVEYLRSMYRSHEGFARLFDALAGRKRASEYTELERLAKEAGVEDYYGVVLFWARELDKMNFAELKMGRRDYKTRLIWSRGLGLLEIGRLARADDPQSGAMPLLTHRFRLRPDFSVEIELPSDLTVPEAQRLADYIKTLPFG